ncbi:uncharacterized protein LOC135390556 [Ornithodoros turicata]|uniref:uncharacterized protein LOC135390556 n=1 Tax=Ornithodoros turicata TaxID=34597 RepID=UPI00313A155C
MAAEGSDLLDNLSSKERQILLRAAEFGSLAFETSPAPRAQRDEHVDAAACGSSSRQNSTDWCRCGSWVAMPTEEECLCCKELQGTPEPLSFSCITEHEDFKLFSLNKTVLKVAHFELPGRREPMSAHIHKRYRYTAYRQFARWVWHKLGKNKRMVIPACAVNTIREAFPSEPSTGFRYARY